jgi:hypothetical protein
MKYNKIFRVLAVAMVISLLVLVIPATPAAAQTISLNPTSGRAGSTLTVTGTGFATGTFIQINFNYGAKQYVQLVGSETTFSASFAVPDISPGTYPVQAVDGATLVQLTPAVYYTILSAEIEIDPDEGPVGTEVEIDGSDFNSREDITIEFDDEDVDIASGDEETDSDGDFTCTILIPESTADEHTITVIGEDSDAEAEAEFTVEPEISIDPTSGAAGTKVSVSGTGFKEDHDIDISFDGSEVSTTIETDDLGSFSGTFTVPTKVKDTYTVKASDGSNKHSVDFTIIAGAELSLTTGNVGTELTVSGTGFTADGTVTIKYGDTQVATGAVDADGAFSVAFEVPASQYGLHTITATDGTNTKQLSFTMESEAPPAPKLLLPETGLKTKAEPSFDWEDVTDDSGVSYTLQIANNKDFTSIVLEKEGLTSSEYTITKEEKLESAKKEAPYYWAVKAVDGASNESEWSTARWFYVGFQWPELKGWLLYLVIGIGAVVIGFLGFWLGRRTAYSSSF